MVMSELDKEEEEETGGVDEIVESLDLAQITHARKRNFLEALVRGRGNITVASRATKIARRNHYHWYDTDLKYKELVDEVKEVSHDYAEYLLVSQMKDNPTLLIFYMKTQMKHRGYVERQENINLNATVDVKVGDEEIPPDLPLTIEDEN